MEGPNIELASNDGYFRCCSHCKQPAAKKCGRCNIVYCNQECQTNDWSIHRTKCSRYDYINAIKMIVANVPTLKTISTMHKIYDGAITVEITDQNIKDQTSVISLCDGAVPQHFNNLGDSTFTRDGEVIKCSKMETNGHKKILEIRIQRNNCSTKLIPIMHHDSTIAMIYPTGQYKPLIPAIAIDESIILTVIENDYCGLKIKNT